MDKRLFKPGGLNFHTISLFIIPVIISIKKEYYDISRGCLLIIISGLMYHYTYIKAFEILDKIMILFCFIYYYTLGYTYTYYYLISIMCMLTSITIYNTLSYSKYGIVFHSLIHLISSTSICLLIYGCSENNECKSLKNITFINKISY